MAVGIGIIGTGKHGARYLQHVADVPAFRLAAICRQDRDAGTRQASDYACRFHGQAQALIDDPDVEAIITVVPPTLNVGIVTAAARAGKALLIEKPLAASVAECRTISEAVARAGTTAMVAHTLRFNAVVQALADARSTVGDLHAAVLTQRFEPSALSWLDRRAIAGGGIILHTGVHSFDLVRHLSGREATRVSAQAWQVVTRETEDAFAAIVELDSGAMRAMVGGSRATAGRCGAIELAGRDGQLVGDHVHGTAARLVRTDREALPVGAPVHTVPAIMQEFAAALIERRAPAITVADGTAAVAIAEACYRSIESGRPEDVERP